MVAFCLTAACGGLRENKKAQRSKKPSISESFFGYRKCKLRSSALKHLSFVTTTFKLIFTYRGVAQFGSFLFDRCLRRIKGKQKGAAVEKTEHKRKFFRVPQV